MSGHVHEVSYLQNARPKTYPFKGALSNVTRFLGQYLFFCHIQQTHLTSVNFDSKF